MPADLHVHTVFSDGKDTPEAMVRAALKRGLTVLGFSDHAHTAFDESWCMATGADAEYRRSIRALQKKYRGELDIRCGVEQDYFSDTPVDGYDYVIGSVHYVFAGGRYVPVDESPEDFREAVAGVFGGDVYAFVEAYYALVGDVVARTRADIVGHFDLIAKFNEHNAFFDPAHPRALAAALTAADRLLESGKPFEINSGAITRGWRSEPYPSDALRELLRARGARFLPAGDCHSAAVLAEDLLIDG